MLTIIRLTRLIKVIKESNENQARVIVAVYRILNHHLIIIIIQQNVQDQHILGYLDQRGKFQLQVNIT